MSERRWWPALGLIAALGVAVRVLWVVAGSWEPGGLAIDSVFYHELANLLADGRGFISPTALDAGIVEPTADKPPLFPLLLAAASKLGFTGIESHRLVGCGLGAATIVLTGLLGRRAGGPGVGLVAAAIAAAYPFFISLDGGLLTEAAYGPLLLLSLLLAYRLMDAPGAGRALASGAVIGLAAMARPEALLLLPLLVLPVLVRAAGPGRPRALWFAAACLAALAVVAPWTARNWSAFDRPVPISSQEGITIGGANCLSTYSGSDLGFWRLDCIPPSVVRIRNEAERAAAARREGLEYAADHAGRLPVVLAARVLRTWELYKPFARAYPGGLPAPPAARLGSYYLLLALAACGLALLRRRGVPLLPLLVPLVLATTITLIGFGYVRFRFAADLALTVPAATALCAAYVRVRGR